MLKIIYTREVKKWRSQIIYIWLLMRIAHYIEIIRQLYSANANEIYLFVSLIFSKSIAYLYFIYVKN